MSDETFPGLLAAAQAGAPWACDRLFRELSPAVTGYVRTQGSDDPEDLTSEVFLAVFSRLQSFRGDEAGFRSWVFTIAHHRLIDERRRRGRRVATAQLDTAEDTRPGGDVEDDALRTLGEGHVRALLETLAPAQRDVLVLRVLADLTVDQVAEVLGKRPGAVKALQRRGLAALRRTIEKEGVPL